MSILVTTSAAGLPTRPCLYNSSSFGGGGGQVKGSITNGSGAYELILTADNSSMVWKASLKSWWPDSWKPCTSTYADINITHTYTAVSLSLALYLSPGHTPLHRYILYRIHTDTHTTYTCSGYTHTYGPLFGRQQTLQPALSLVIKFLHCIITLYI